MPPVQKSSPYPLRKPKSPGQGTVPHPYAHLNKQSTGLSAGFGQTQSPFNNAFGGPALPLGPAQGTTTVGSPSPAPHPYPHLTKSPPVQPSVPSPYAHLSQPGPVYQNPQTEGQDQFNRMYGPNMAAQEQLDAMSGDAPGTPTLPPLYQRPQQPEPSVPHPYAHLSQAPDVQPSVPHPYAHLNRQPEEAPSLPPAYQNMQGNEIRPLHSPEYYKSLPGPYSMVGGPSPSRERFINTSPEQLANEAIAEGRQYRRSYGRVDETRSLPGAPSYPVTGYTNPTYEPVQEIVEGDPGTRSNPFHPRMGQVLPERYLPERLKQKGQKTPGTYKNTETGEIKSELELAIKGIPTQGETPWQLHQAGEVTGRPGRMDPSDSEFIGSLNRDDVGARENYLKQQARRRGFRYDPTGEAGVTEKQLQGHKASGVLGELMSRRNQVEAINRALEGRGYGAMAASTLPDSYGLNKKPESDFMPAGFMNLYATTWKGDPSDPAADKIRMWAAEEIKKGRRPDSFLPENSTQQVKQLVMNLYREMEGLSPEDREKFTGKPVVYDLSGDLPATSAHEGGKGEGKFVGGPGSYVDNFGREMFLWPLTAIDFVSNDKWDLRENGKMFRGGTPLNLSTRQARNLPGNR